MTDPGAPDPLAVELVAALAGRGWTVATAESLTAGLLAARIAGVPGASTVLRGGLVVYATDLKSSLAGVSPEIVRRYGAVSPETAHALAVGASRRCEADIGVGLTGVAGPDEQEGRPVGTVYVGLVTPRGPARSMALTLPGNRAAVRDAACSRALQLLLEEIGPGTGNESDR